MTTTIEWDGVDSSTIPELIIGAMTRSVLGEEHGTSVKVPGLAGTYFFEDEPGDKVFTFQCAVLVELVDPTMRDAAVIEVGEWYGHRGVNELRISSVPGRFYLGRIGSQVDTTEWRQLGEFELQWIVGPYGFAEAESTQHLDVVASPASGSFGVPDGIGAPAVVEITPTNGTITSFSFTLNGNTITYTSPTIASGSTVTISSISQNVLLGANGDTMLTGAFDPNDVILAGVSGFWPLMVPGTNNWNFEWTGTATDVDIDITWRRRYL